MEVMRSPETLVVIQSLNVLSSVLSNKMLFSKSMNINPSHKMLVGTNIFVALAASFYRVA
jgi:hypothetical protein